MLTRRIFNTSRNSSRLSLRTLFFLLSSSYQLPNPQTLNVDHSPDVPLIPDRKEQQRILFPYRQSLLVPLLG